MKCFPKNHQNTSKNIPIFTQGQFRPRSPDRTTTLLATNQPANTPDSPESPRFLLRESPPDQPVAVEEAPVFEGAAG